MSVTKIPSGVYPVMLTPFTKENKVDYASLYRYVKYYEKEKVDGLFAICQSSEIFKLSLTEKKEIVKFIKANTTLPIVASGHTQNSIDEQISELSEIAEEEPEAIVLISNRFADENEDDDIFIKNLSYFLDNFDEGIKLGMYECPYPYKRLISDKVLKYMLQTKRFVFLKDTSCDIEIIKRRLAIAKGTEFGLYNAHALTLVESLLHGGSGYSGIHANISARVMCDIYKNYKKKNDKLYKAEKLMLDMDTYATQNIYPVSAKEINVLREIFDTIVTRVKDYQDFNQDNIEAAKRIYSIIKEYENSNDN